MFESTQSIGQAFVQGLWGLFGIYVPGFSFTIGQLWIGIALCSLSLLVLKLFFGIGGHGVSSRTNSTDNPKISEERRKDQF